MQEIVKALSIYLFTYIDILQVVAETITEIGDPKEAICEAVQKMNIDLLILGSHSRGPLER